MKKTPMKLLVKCMKKCGYEAAESEVLHEKSNTNLAFDICCFSLYFLIFSMKGDLISAKIPIDEAKYVTICKISEDEIAELPVAERTISDEMLQEFIMYFEDMTLQNLYNLPFSIDSPIKYKVHVTTFNDKVWITMTFYDDDAVIIDGVYGDKPAFHGRYKIVRTNLVAFFETILQQYNEVKGG